jgi:hypothetical protein
VSHAAGSGGGRTADYADYADFLHYFASQISVKAFFMIGPSGLIIRYITGNGQPI